MVSEGDFIYTSSTPGEATTSPTRGPGAVGKVIELLAGEPSMIEWWGVPDPENGGAGHSITEDGGSAFTARGKLDFRHGLDVTDNSGSDSTRVAVDESELSHDLLGGVSADDHHAQSHGHTGADGSGTVSHANLTGVTANQHHNEDHQARHNSGGGDALKLDDLATPDDNTDLNASTSRHGLLRKLDNVSTHFMDGQGNWSDPPSGTGGVAPFYLAPIYGVGHVNFNVMGTSNRGVFVPVTVPVALTVTGVRIRVGTSSGNVCVALYDESFNRLATSGSAACPASGLATVNFGSSAAISAGRYWLALSVDNNTATFSRNGDGNNPAPGNARLQNTVFPLPDPAAPSSTEGGIFAFNLIGVVSGGWP